jgi:peptide/nickel transport system substrate-binding protein
MKTRKLLLSMLGIIVIASMVLTACQTTTPTEIEEPGEAVQPATEEEAKQPAPEVEEQPSLDMKNSDTFVVITGAGEPETMDPHWTYETAGSAVQNNIYEAVVWFNKERTDEFVPVLSTGWEVNEAGDVWTFNIRDGVTFHEGGTLEPHDVAYSMHRALLQDRIDGPHWMTHEAFFGLFSIEDLAIAVADDPEATYENLSEDVLAETCELVKSAIAYDDTAGTVTYKLNRPTPWFMAILANSFAGAIVDKEWMIENGDWDDDCNTWTQLHDPAAEDSILYQVTNGTGPYKLDHWIPGEEIVLVANDDYWRTEPIWEGGPSGVASIPRVLMKNIDEWGTRLAMFEAGDADFIYVPSTFRSQIADDAGLVCYDESGEWRCEEGAGYYKMYRDLPQPAMTPAQFNWQINTEGGNPFIGSGELDGNGVPPDFFSDEHVRKAFNYCFDFDAVIHDAMGGEGIQAQGPIIAGMMGYREGEAPLFYYDMAKCEAEFKEAFGGELWESGFYMQLAYNIGNEVRRIASEIIKAGVESVNPDFTVEVVGMPWPVLLNSRRAQRLPIYVGGWLEDFHDPHNWVHPFLHSQGAYGRVINMSEDVAEMFDGMIEEAASYTTVEERRPLYEEIQLLAQEYAVVLWMYQGVARYHLQDWIYNVYYNPAYSHPIYSYIYALEKH